MQGKGKIVMLDPVGEVEAQAQQKARPLEDVHGKTLAFLFNGHHSAVDLWRFLQVGLTGRFQLAGTLDRWKPNLAAPAPRSMIQELLEKADGAVVGVGA